MQTGTEELKVVEAQNTISVFEKELDEDASFIITKHVWAWNH